ncbi:phage tail sheath family protein [Pseudomonas khavaziana]|uniref:phage tail sheath family protein n=1 Tax=Pseudomonas khavaziana TaxID=2842351 RepID=UPI001C3E5707|nr:phage tail sheath C-terminal domain-containing protein [Pseudomonas khavaziana]MBV4482645.1 phage tail sheath subtilisin-like domain-containing protein [Pseudomonas khavaziana]
MNYQTPGVYVEESNALSLGIQSGQTAVPVFVGHFDAIKKDGTLDKQPPVQCVRIDSWLSFTQQFASDSSATFSIGLDGNNNVVTHGTNLGAASVRMFIENGGGMCYVLPVNNFKKAISQIVPAIDLCPDITLLCWCEHRSESDDQSVVTELGKLTGSEKSGGMQSRFLLIDAALINSMIAVPIVTDPHHAAAYFPALRTAYRHTADIEAVPLKGLNNAPYNLTGEFNIKKLRDKCDENLKKLSAAGELVKKSAMIVKAAAEVDKITVSTTSWEKVFTLLHAINDSMDKSNSDAAEKDYKALASIITIASAPKAFPTLVDFKSNIENYKTLYEASLPVQKLLKTVIKVASEPVVLRASVAMAGVYARTDRERGVWKAPANVELSSVAGLVAVDLGANTVSDIRIDDAFNNTLVENKVNAIRAFSGRGHLVWGARTMAGPSETAWRYVSVRRLFSTVERDVQDALRVAMFEPNSQPTWMSVRSAISHYLHRLWQDGALAGATPAEAYFVRVGLHETMTEEDVNNGRMLVSIGLAAVRPAEFIVLQLTQDMGAT